MPTNLCTIITPDLVARVTKMTATRAEGGAGCQYNGPQGLLLSASTSQLSGDGQSAFDDYVQAQETGGIIRVPGLGDGNGATATHDVNTTTYAFRGKTVVTITVFEPTAEAKAHGQALMKSVLDTG